MKQGEREASVSSDLSLRRRHSHSLISARGTLYHHQLQPTTTNAADILEESDKSVRILSYLKIFRFATIFEKFVILLGVLMGIIMGICIPAGLVAYGEFTMLLLERIKPVGPTSPSLILPIFGGGKIIVNGTVDELKEALKEDSLAFCLSTVAITLVQLIVGIFSIDLLNFTAMKQVGRIRVLLLKSILSQEIAYYDLNHNINFAAKVSDDLERIRDGMGEKIGIFTFLISSFVFSIIISFVYGWKLTLVVLCSTPVIIIASIFVSKVQSTLTNEELKAYNKAGVIAEETLGSIRTVVAFGGEAKEIERYTENLKDAKKMGYRKGLYTGLGLGIQWLVIYLGYAIAFYYGVRLIMDDRDKEDKEYTVAVLMIVFFGVLASVQNLGLVTPHIEAFASADAAALTVYKIIDRTSSIDPLSSEGEKPKIAGEIEFQNVVFSYPSRPQLKILRGINIQVKPGKIVAFVGSSGCGKSTCLQLIQRLYDCSSGKIFIDNHDIRSLNVNWLRNHIGVVGQEPILFGTTIKDNILYGNPSGTLEDVHNAAKSANCHDFIIKLPNGYNTMVGEQGAQLSGGQKQRIAIARALIRDPKILLLDEATSALDLQSEATVQKALDTASQGRTTIIVTHRLSTIVNCDLIYYMDSGVVIEKGTHQELMKLGCNYYKLVAANTHPRDDKLAEDKTSTENEEYKIPLEISTDSEKSSPSESMENVIMDIFKQKKISMKRIMMLNAKEWHLILMGSIASFVLGGTLPAFAIIFGDIYYVLSLDDSDEVMSRTVIYCIYFVIIGVVTCLGNFFQNYLFNVSGSRMTARLRSESFSTMLHQEMGWFDDPKNSVGALGVRLSGDCGAVQGATGTKIGAILQAASALIIGIVFSFFFSWKMTLISLIAMPVILGTVYLEERILGGEGIEEKAAMENSSKIATEAISNIRTVAGLCQENAVLERYTEDINRVSVSIEKKSRLRGLVFSLGQSSPFFTYAIALYYGGYLVANEEMEYQDVIKVSESLIFGSWMIGQSLAYAPNINAAKVSAVRLLKLLDRKPKIVSTSKPITPSDWAANGQVEYNNVNFCYPNRPETQILDNFTLQMYKGQTIALVGSSGCGKSTCMQLLQRFYEVDSGSISMDNYNIKDDMSISKLRSQLGIVSQEPVLFDKTIAENIAYGDNSRTVSIEEIIQAATDANIHGFIKSLPLGYETRLGTKGAQLSGGQKQRIAIARALVRNPRVLLLDEATSALDSHSEKIVQEALDKASKGRTCIIIAHRLATIKNADVIMVVDKGKVAESGSHEQLIKLGGLYAQLHALQNFWNDDD